jgi:hypothetical protein
MIRKILIAACCLVVAFVAWTAWSAYQNKHAFEAVMAAASSDQAAHR